MPTHPIDCSPDRRRFLQGGAALGGLLATRPVAAPSAAWPKERKTRHVILVAFSGGVRTRETLGTPDNVPFLEQMADEGVAFPRTRAANLGHFGATLTLFTGVGEARGIRENARGPNPTLFEYARRDLGLAPSDVWISTSGGPQQTNFSYSTHRDYGVRFGANTLDGDGLFNREFAEIVEQYGRPRPRTEAERALVDKLRSGIGEREASLNSAESARMLERYILEELNGGTAEIRGPNAGDAKAMRVARNVCLLFKPKLLGVVLQNADVAHGSFNGYVEVIRQNDAALGELWSAVRADPELAESTAIIVVPEFGRDADLNSRRGLDHGDGSDDLLYVSTVCWGPDFRRGRVVSEDVRVVDICPTVCDLLEAPAPFARGRRLPGLFA